MSEVKNEGLEVVAHIVHMDTHARAFLMAYNAKQFHADNGGSFIGPVCRHSEALAGYAVRDARIAELEGDLKCAHSMLGEVSKKGMELRAELARVAQADAHYQAEALRLASELAAIKSQEPVAWMLKNEKGRIEEILPYMPCASDMQPYWPEPFPLYAAPVAKQVVMPEREWLQSDGLIYSLENDVNYYEINVTQVEGNRHDGKRAEFASKLIELLNAADQEGGQDE